MVTEKQQRYKTDEIFDNKLKQYRIEKNISTTQLAKLSGTSQSFISALEVGQISPIDQKGNLKKSIDIICDILQCKIFDMFPRDYCQISEESIFDEYIDSIFDIDNRELIYDEEFNKKIMTNYIQNILNDIYKEFANDPPRKKCLLYLIQHYILDMTMMEIADYYGISRSLVGQRIARGLTLLRHPARACLLYPWYNE